MNIVLAVQMYVEEMIRSAGPGMKVLLVDKETTAMITCIASMTDIMQTEVYLVESLNDRNRDAIKYLKCIVFVRPTANNVQLLCEELRSPRFGHYHIYFSNKISKTDVKMLAEADEQESVRDVFEFFFDSIALAPHLASLEIPQVFENRFSLSPTVFRRSLHSLLALCLALNKRPYIRYQSSSRDSQRLGDELSKLFVTEKTLFEERIANSSDDDTMLLILSRSEDVVSPLLNQWTYEAMVHELLGIVNKQVKIRGEDGKMNNVLLSENNDEFYATNMYLNFGELGQNIKELMEEYQAKHKQTRQNVESIADMKQFLDQYPQFKKISGTVLKHFNMLSELNKLVSTCNLLGVSELEQTIVSTGERSQCLESVQNLLRDSNVRNIDALRLVMLYALRFESSSTVGDDLTALVSSLKKQRNIPPREIAAIKTLLEYGGVARRQNDLFGNQSAMEITKRFIKGLKGVENIFTHHQPYLGQVIDQVAKGRLPDSMFPFTGSANSNRSALASSCPENLIVFIVGGATYEESAWIHNYNQQVSQQRARGRAAPRILLASTHIHNFKSFLEEMVHLAPGGSVRINVES